MPSRLQIILLAISAICLATASHIAMPILRADESPQSRPDGKEPIRTVIPTRAPKPPKADSGDSDVDYWLKQAQATTRPTKTAEESIAAGGVSDKPSREDALPGVIELSNGKVLAGFLATTAEKPWVVYVESQQRNRTIPFLSVLSISAVVEEEAMEPEWRWKEMGVPEKVFTGREYPTRRFQWKFHLIDDSTVTGVIKGQPLWLELRGERIGPMTLSERTKGDMGQKLPDLIYPKRIIVSRRLMDEVLKDTPAKTPDTKPSELKKTVK